MKNTTLATCAAIVAAALAGSAMGDLFQIDINGEVDFGSVNVGQWANAHSGDPVTMSFQVDSNNFMDSTNFPVRGYEVISSSFDLTIAGNSAGMANPYPNGLTPYFVLRDNDPAVDGFFLTNHIDGFEEGIFTDEAAQLDPTFGALFTATYEGTRLSSLDIAGAVGTYDFTGISSFNWGLTDSFAQPMGFIFDHWTISAVPAPASLFGLVPLGLMGARRRRG